MIFASKHVAMLLLILALKVIAFDKRAYFSVEHATLEYFNPKYFKFFNMTSIRYSRKNILYYFNVHFYFKSYIGNNASFHFFFYNEAMPHLYKATFVDIRNKKVCDFLNNEPVFGAAVKKALQANNMTCPIAPGEYNLQNMTMDGSSLLRMGFPYEKGRIYMNITFNPLQERMVLAYIDFQVKPSGGRNP